MHDIITIGAFDAMHNGALYLNYYYYYYYYYYMCNGINNSGRFL